MIPTKPGTSTEFLRSLNSWPCLSVCEYLSRRFFSYRYWHCERLVPYSCPRACILFITVPILVVALILFSITRTAEQYFTFFQHVGNIGISLRDWRSMSPSILDHNLGYGLVWTATLTSKSSAYLLSYIHNKNSN